MDNLTQSCVDAMVADFKAQVLKKIGGRSIAVAMVCDNSVSRELAGYELDVLPAIIEQGFTAPTVSELFGVKLSIKDCTNG